MKRRAGCHAHARVGMYLHGARHAHASVDMAPNVSADASQNGSRRVGRQSHHAQKTGRGTERWDCRPTLRADRFLQNTRRRRAMSNMQLRAMEPGDRSEVAELVGGDASPTDLRCPTEDGATAVPPYALCR